MKKVINFNFITVAILAAVLLLIALCVHLEISELASGTEAVKSELAGNMDGEIDDVEGWGIIFGGAALGFAWLAVGMVWIALVLVPTILGGGMIILATIARLIYKNTEGRILAYRIFMTLTYLLMMVLAGLLATMVFVEEVTVVTLVFLVPFIYTVVMIILGARNTYTSRLYGDMLENSCKEVM